MPVEARTPDVAGAPGQGGTPSGARPDDVGVGSAAASPPWASAGLPPGADAGMLARASSEQLLQAAVRATREAAHAAAELRRWLEQRRGPSPT
jgi:hypothetical protein